MFVKGFEREASKRGKQESNFQESELAGSNFMFGIIH